MLTKDEMISPIAYCELSNVIYLNYNDLLSTDQGIKRRRMGRITKNYENNIINLKNFIIRLQVRETLQKSFGDHKIAILF